jgi:hypothetical protein
LIARVGADITGFEAGMGKVVRGANQSLNLNLLKLLLLPLLLAKT